MLHRRFLIILLVICGASILSAQNYTNDGGKGKSIAFEEPTVIENGREVKSTFSQMFRNRLQSVWLSNSAIEVVAKEELENMIAVQRRSQDARHSDSSSIEAGSFKAELFSASTTIEISSSHSFKVMIKIVDNSKGLMLVNWESPKYDNQDDFLSYAANDVALYALPILGVNLSSLAKSSLSYRKNRDNESLMDAKGRVDNLTTSIAELDRQLSELTKSQMHDLGAVAEKARLEAEREQLQVQEREAKNRLKRLEEDEKRLEEDRQKAKSRSDELNKKIKENGIKYDKIADQKRSEYSKELTANARISILENKKQTLLKMRADTIERIEKYYIQEDKDCQKKIAQIEEEPYSSIDKDEKGRVTKAAQRERARKIESVKPESNERKQKYLEEQYAKLFPSYEAIRTEINEDIAGLKGQKEYSLLNVNLLRFGNYDGSKKAWVAYISLSLAGDIISNEKILIPYKNITGKAGGYKTNEEKVAYSTTVEEYNSYFANNIPVIYVEINYDIEPLSLNKPSQYRVKINSYVFKRIEGDEAIFTIKASSPAKTVSILPQVPIDYSHTLQASHLSSELNKREKERKKQEKARKESMRQKTETTVEVSKNKGQSSENENDTSSSNSVMDDVFALGYIPLGVDFGLSYTYKANLDLEINSAYLFYTPFFDVGPEVKIFFTPQQFDFAVTAKLQKEIYNGIYIAGNAGLDFFSTYPRHIAFIVGAEAGYIFLQNWSVSLKLDISTQPQYLFRLGANYYFK